MQKLEEVVLALEINTSAIKAAKSKRSKMILRRAFNCFLSKKVSVGMITRNDEKLERLIITRDMLTELHEVYTIVG